MGLITLVVRVRKDVNSGFVACGVMMVRESTSEWSSTKAIVAQQNTNPFDDRFPAPCVVPRLLKKRMFFRSTLFLIRTIYACALP